jgi:gamma-glutamyl-gamma-aminobutyrate hydrolase PuuD
MKVYSYGYPIDHWIDGRVVKAKTIKEADVVIMPGGADVHPSIYREPVGLYTSADRNYDERDIRVYKEAVGRGIPIVGICRGHQMLSALNGARLIQDLNHPGGHKVTTYTGEVFSVNSLHHQAVFPFNLPPDHYRLLAWANNLSPHHLDGENKEIAEGPIKEVEAIYFPMSRAFGVQGHPEWANSHPRFVEWCNEMLIRVLDGDTFNDALVNEEAQLITV